MISKAVVVCVSARCASSTDAVSKPVYARDPVCLKSFEKPAVLIAALALRMSAFPIDPADDAAIAEAFRRVYDPATPVLPRCLATHTKLMGIETKTSRCRPGNLGCSERQAVDRVGAPAGQSVDRQPLRFATQPPSARC